MLQERTYDRTAETLGNIVDLGHVNVQVSDQRLATAYYITGLGLTRDPYLVTGTNNMWVNVGTSQFHLPTGEPQVLRGTVGLVVPSLDDLRARLQSVRKELDGTKFAVRDDGDAVRTVSPWGNRIDLYGPDPARFGPIVLGMAYVELETAPDVADGIARFYREILGALADVREDARGRYARVMSGARQELRFREQAGPEAHYDDDHVQIYLADFAGPYQRLRDRGLVSQESNRHQFRFRDIVDLDTRRVLYTFDHEVRSMTHPMYARPLVNRNATLTNANYAPGYEAQPWALQS